MDQLNLIPDERSEPDMVFVGVDELPANAELIGDDPPVDFVQSIQVYGVLNPIVVYKNGNGYKVMDGRKRVKGCRSAGLDRIPALVYGREWAMPEVIALVTNQQRRKNLASDYISLVKLLDGGASEKEIAVATGMPVGVIRARMRLRNLAPDLLSAFLSGQISATTADKASRLAPHTQQRLAGRLAEKGTLTLGDIDQARQVQQDAAVASVAIQLFEEEKPIQTVAPGVAVDVDASSVKFTFSAPNGVQWTGEVSHEMLFNLLNSRGLVFSRL